MTDKKYNTELNTRLRFGEWLVHHRLVSEAALQKALEDQESRGGRLGEVLERLEVLESRRITESLSQYLDLPCWFSDALSDIDLSLAQALPERVARRFLLVPIRYLSNQSIQVAMTDPLDVVARDTVARMLDAQIKVAVSSTQEIQKAIEAVYQGSQVQEQRIRDLVDVVATELEGDDGEFGEAALDEADVSNEEDANHAPVVQFVNLLLSQAVQSRASDIHIEPQDKSMSVRMRVDGMLREMIPPPRKMQSAVIARVKILSGMNIAERRLPQDGRLIIKTSGRQIDVRVSVLPTIYGEKVVMRILDKTAVKHDLGALGFSEELLHDFTDAITKPHGIIVVTGPTGSGKSTTLYSALSYLMDTTKNITTVEDPVEYRLAGINQIQIRPDIGLTFASCLRSILRQDPDIILIGEIRDRETMEIAIQASLTGHLVLTTFHTNDAPSALSRFVYMGLEPYLLASTVNLVTAQRLLRCNCEHCKEPFKINPKRFEGLDVPDVVLAQDVFYKGKGCHACGGTGYAGRVPVFEFLPMNESARRLVCEGASEIEIRTHLRQAGYSGLAEDAFRYLCQGKTTFEEVLRVAYVKQNTRANHSVSDANETYAVSGQTSQLDLSLSPDSLTDTDALHQSYRNGDWL